jgi:hypothetical protein
MEPCDDIENERKQNGNRHVAAKEVRHAAIKEHRQRATSRNQSTETLDRDGIQKLSANWVYLLDNEIRQF